MISDSELAEIMARVDATTGGPWFYDGYSAVFSGPMIEKDEAFWTDERFEDGHTYDHRVGKICPACGERPAIYGDTAKPEVRGQRFGTYWDCKFHKDAYDVDPVVVTAPAQMGDTATGRHAADADFIAHAKDDVPRLVEEIKRLHELMTPAQHELDGIGITWQSRAKRMAKRVEQAESERDQWEKQAIHLAGEVNEGCEEILHLTKERDAALAARAEAERMHGEDCRENDTLRAQIAAVRKLADIWENMVTDSTVRLFCSQEIYEVIGRENK